MSAMANHDNPVEIRGLRLTFFDEVG